MWGASPAPAEAGRPGPDRQPHLVDHLAGCCLPSEVPGLKVHLPPGGAALCPGAAGPLSGSTDCWRGPPSFEGLPHSGAPSCSPAFYLFSRLLPTPNHRLLPSAGPLGAFVSSLWARLSTLKSGPAPSFPGLSVAFPVAGRPQLPAPVSLALPVFPATAAPGCHSLCLRCADLLRAPSHRCRLACHQPVGAQVPPAAQRWARCLSAHRVRGLCCSAPR